MRMVVCGRGAESPVGEIRMALLRSLVAEGHVVSGFDPLRHGATRIERTTQLAALLSGVAAELCVVVPTPGDVDLDELRRATAELGVLTLALHTVTTFPGAPTDLGELEAHARAFDLVAVPHAPGAAAARPWVRHGLVELAPAVCPLALDEAPVEAVDLATIVCVGDADADNAHLVRSVASTGVDVIALGTGWDDVADLRHLCPGRPSMPERNALLAGATVVVELPATVTDRSLAGCSVEDTMLSQPALDAVALGTPVVAIDRPGLREHLEPDLELLVARRADDLPDLLRLVLSTPDLLRAVGLAGQQRLRVEHQWRHRWTTLWDWFGADEPLSAASATAGVSVIVPVVEATTADALAGTVASVVAGEVRSRVFMVGDRHDLDVAGADALTHAEGVEAIEVPGADDALGIMAGTSWALSEYLTVVRPGTVVPPGRFEAQAAALDAERDLDVVAGIGEVPARFHRWDLVRRWLLDGQAQLGGAMVRRRVMSDRLGPAVITGRADAIVDSVRALRYRAIELPALALPSPVTVTLDDVPIAAAYPQFRRCADARRALGGAYAMLASELAHHDGPAAVTLAGRALDQLDDGHGVLGEVASGRRDLGVLDEVAAELGHDLRAVAPTTEDRVWNHTGGTIANHRLVLDIDWTSPEVGFEIIESYCARFAAGEPVELALLAPTTTMDEMISRVASHLIAHGVDVEAAADITMIDAFERHDSDLVVRLHGPGALEQAAEAEQWMSETRTELDLVVAV